jgi:hypothetical protein
VTFATVVERFKRLYIEKSKLRTGKVMIQQIEKHLMPTFRDAEFNTIKRRSLMELLDKIEAEHGASMADFDIEFSRPARRIIRSSGYHRPLDLVDIKPKAFAAKHLTIRDHRGILETIIQRSIQAPRVIDIEKRIRAIVHRTGVGNITSFKKHYDKQFERLQDRLSLIDVNDRLYWVPSVRSVKGVGKCVMYHKPQSSNLLDIAKNCAFASDCRRPRWWSYRCR